MASSDTANGNCPDAERGPRRVRREGRCTSLPEVKLDLPHPLPITDDERALFNDHFTALIARILAEDP